MFRDIDYLSKPYNEDKYHDIDYLMEIFENRRNEEFLNVKNAQNLTDEQIEIFCKFAVLRRNTLDEMEKEIKERKEANPKASEEELSMGAYKEYIEPQVRNTVLSLRRKGYSTYESGFCDFDSQVISFEKNHLDKFILPENMIKEIGDKGVAIEIEQNRIVLKFSCYKNLEEIKEIWEKIDTVLPDIGNAVQPCELNQAVDFRNKQAELE